MHNIRNAEGIFFLLLIGLFFFLGHHKIINLPPQSMHKWRQSDSASFAWNYYQKDANLLHPQFHNLYNEGKAAAEFPLLYWIIGMLYRLFDPHHFFFRGLHLLIVFSAIWALFRTANLLLKDPVWASLFALVFLSSPLLTYYSNGFISDPPAWAMVCWGYYSGYLYQSRSRFSYLIATLVAFTLASLLKISMASSLIALGLIGVWKYHTQQVNGRILSQRSTLLLPLLYLSCLILIILWYSYATGYVTGFERPHFSSILRPIYDVPVEEIASITGNLFRFHLPFLFPWVVGLPLISWMLASLFIRSSAYRTERVLIILLWIANLIFLFFFFYLMGIHDYYLISFLPVITIQALLGLRVLQHKWPLLFHHWKLKIIMAGLVITGLYQAKTQLRLRYFGRTMNYKEHPAFYEKAFQSYLLQLGITAETPVVSVPDKSPNNTLYLMNRSGWSNSNFALDQPTAMQPWIDNDQAAYLVVSDMEVLTDEDWSIYLQDSVGFYKGIRIYKLHAKGFHVEP